MAFVIRFEKFRSVGYWTGTTADTEKEKAKLYATKGEAQEALARIKLNRTVSAKIVFDIWNQKRKVKTKSKAMTKKKTQRVTAKKAKKKSSSKRSRASA